MRDFHSAALKVVTKVGERGQVGIRGSSVTDEWEKLIKTAASRNGQTFADFVVDTTRAAALAIVKREETVSATLPARIEDVAASLIEQLAKMGAEQQDRLDRIERQGRRGRWRR